MQATQTQQILPSVKGARGLFFISPMMVLCLFVFVFVGGGGWVVFLISSKQLQLQLFQPQHGFPSFSNRCPSIGFVQKYRFGMPTAERSNGSKKSLQQHLKLQSCGGLRAGTGDRATGCRL